MATKSVLKNIKISSKKSVASLVNALENANKKGSAPVKFKRSFSDASREDIRKMFGAGNDRIQGS